MLLDDLITVIETLKERIATHGPALRENETRTRMALIDPLLKALGWDTSDPAMVLPEYDVSGRKADYALLGGGGSPSATVEAKKLGEPLASHRMQMLNYSNASGVEYAGLTDGDKWELYEVFKRGQLEERRILDLSISDAPAHQCALKLLLLWRPNLASGQPVVAEAPVFISTDNHVAEPTSPAAIPESRTVNPLPTPDPASTAGEWLPLTAVKPEIGHKRPSAIRFSYGEARSTSSWGHVLAETAEWLVKSGDLKAVDCPIPGLAGFVNSSPTGPRGGQYSSHLPVTAAYTLEQTYTITTLLATVSACSDISVRIPKLSSFGSSERGILSAD